MEHTIAVPRTLRYRLSQSPGPHIRTVWMALHGYGQLAEFFMRKLTPLFSESTLVVVPEAPHRFYRHGHSGRVGASWMTRESRETDIADNHLFLDELYASIVPAVPNAAWRMLAFSQGAATAVRWLGQGVHSFDQVVLWAGSFPHDFNFERGTAILNTMALTVVVGDQDEFIDDKSVASASEWLTSKGVKHRVDRFTGNHDIPSEVLRRLHARWMAP